MHTGCFGGHDKKLVLTPPRQTPEILDQFDKFF